VRSLSLVQYIRVGTAVTLAPQLFAIFYATLCLRFQQPHTWNKVLIVLNQMFRFFTMFTSSILISIFPLSRNILFSNPTTKYKATISRSTLAC
jgi:hypothetical protein